MQHLYVTPLDLVAPSRLGACFEVLGNEGTVGDIALLLVIDHPSARAAEHSGIVDKAREITPLHIAPRALKDADQSAGRM